MRRIGWICCLFLLGLMQTGVGQHLKWQSWEELPALQRAEGRPMLVYVYADWCKYCVMQEKLVFQDSLIAARLEAEFYCLKLNAEEKKSLPFLGRTYQFRPTGPEHGQHELAAFLGNKNGQISFPTLVFLSEMFQPLARKQGFMPKEELLLWMEKGTEKSISRLK